MDGSIVISQREKSQVRSRSTCLSLSKPAKNKSINISHAFFSRFYGYMGIGSNPPPPRAAAQKNKYMEEP